MHLELEPNRGANSLLFGKRRDEVRRTLGHLVFTTKPHEPQNDFCEKEGLILGYDEQDELEFIEIVKPSSAEFRNIRFFELDLPDVLARMRSLGFSADYDDGGYNFTSIGIALYCPQGELESVSLYREGYYDNL
jgi:hypothetical protein